MWILPCAKNHQDRAEGGVGHLRPAEKGFDSLFDTENKLQFLKSHVFVSFVLIFCITGEPGGAKIIIDYQVHPRYLQDQYADQMKFELVQYLERYLDDRFCIFFAFLCPCKRTVKLHI